MAKKGAAHGGAWKVAYADFVTAMMALFMVLWISAQDPKIVIATSEYFKNPFVASAADATSGVLPFNNKRSAPNDGKEAGPDKEKDSERQIKMMLNSVAAEFSRLLHLEENLGEKPIDLEITADGLRVTVFDRGSKPLFVDDTAELTEWGSFVMQNLAWVIDRHHFRVIIDGHARADLAIKREDYGGWELSSDRALAARRSLVHYAVESRLIEQVAGYGDTRPLPNVPPSDESNQRITLSLSLSSRAFRDTKLVERPVRPDAAATKPSS